MKYVECFCWLHWISTFDDIKSNQLSLCSCTFTDEKCLVFLWWMIKVKTWKSSGIGHKLWYFYWDILNYNTVRADAYYFTLLPQTIRLLNGSNSVAEPGTTVDNSWQPGSGSEVSDRGQLLALSYEWQLFTSPLNITWALPPTRHAAQYHNVSSETVEPGGEEGEGDGDNLRCDLEDEDCRLATQSLCKQKLPGLTHYSVMAPWKQLFVLTSKKSYSSK